MNEPLNPAQVRAARALLAWSQQDLARNAQVGASTVADFERGQRTPVPNNADAMRSALEDAGVKFMAGGAVLTESLPSPEGLASGSPIRWIEASDLSDWADRRDCQDGLPELLSRLVLATWGHSAVLLFPSGDSVQFPGFDGRCTVPSDHGVLPGGKSYWEIGAQRTGITGKADEDYTKRTRDPGDVKLKDATFVFVTPRRWSRKQTWASRRREEGKWKDVRAIDGDDLVHWIELHPAVGHWLAVRIGKRPHGIRQLPELWSEWSCATQRPLTTDLMLIGRDEEGARIHRWLRDPPSILSLQGEAADEVIAFLSAVINELPPAYRDPYLARALVPEDADTARILADGLSPLIIVLNSPEPGLAQQIAAKGHHVFAAFGADTGPSGDAAVQLTRPRRHEIEECLMGMGFDHHEARNLANDTARSLTVLRRLIPAAPSHQPHWAKAQPSRALLVALLAGGWIDENKQDRVIIEALAEQKYDQFVQEITPLAVTLDGPIRKSGGAWKLASPRDAWLLLSRYLTNADVERFIQAFSMVLSEIDPRFNVPEGEEPLGLLQDVGPSYSGLLRRGLSETIILMSLFGDRAVCVSRPNERAERAVADLLGKADEHLWWSLNSDFQRLAEGAPEAFLDGLSDALARSPTPLSVLFKQGKDTIFGREYLSDLLWALERLAWSVPLFARVSSVLAGLAEIDPGGRFTNRPANTLRHIFLLWSPQTNATLEERLCVLDILRRRHPNSSWALMIAITPKAQDISTPNVRPQWRDFSIDRMEEVTYDLIGRGATEIITRLLHDVGVDVGRWEQVISLVGGLEPTLRAMASARLRKEATLITDGGDRAKLRDILRRFLNHHRSFPDAEWAISESELENFQCVYDQLEPSDLLERHAYLFDSGTVLVRPPGHQWDVNEKLADQLRVEAVEALISQGGAADILRLARAVKNAGWVGRATMESSASDAIKAELIKTGLRSDDQREADLCLRDNHRGPRAAQSHLDGRSLGSSDLRRLGSTSG